MKRFLINTILATAIAAPAGANQLSLESNFSGVTWDRDRHEASHNAPIAGLHIADDDRASGSPHPPRLRLARIIETGNESWRFKTRA